MSDRGTGSPTEKNPPRAGEESEVPFAGSEPMKKIETYGLVAFVDTSVSIGLCPVLRPLWTADNGEGPKPITPRIGDCGNASARSGIV